MKLPRLLRIFSVGIVLTAGVLGSGGCVAVAAGAVAGAGTVAYVRGQLNATVDKPFDDVARAASTALQQLQFIKSSEKKDALIAILTARTAEDRNVEIKVRRQSDKLTTIAIRVGLFGDETLSRIVLEKINANL
jgi:hypothetical protein